MEKPNNKSLKYLLIKLAILEELNKLPAEELNNKLVTWKSLNQKRK